jgi:uncharacterized protein GlcG (DUF336 family)
MQIKLDHALTMIAAARKEAQKINVPMVIAVVDEAGHLIAQQRMDDALLVSLDIALSKAYSAVAVKMATDELGALAQPGQPLFGIHTCDNSRIVIFGGGFPIKYNGRIIGGIGVSGGSVEEDMRCAHAGLNALVLPE